MSRTWLSFLYTLTDTHVGAAGAEGAVDLPIVREATTELPFLPDTALKGVARHTPADLNAPVESYLFGRPLGQREAREGHSDVGHLSITQGHLLLYPLRCLQRPFVYATCPLLLGRLDRLCRSYGLQALPIAPSLLNDRGRVRVANEALFNQALVVEGRAWAGKDVQFEPDLVKLGQCLKTLFFTGEDSTAARVAQDLVLLPDEDFLMLVRTAPPVRARISIDPETGTTSGDKGNLWYEEMLPSDCLFWSIIDLDEKNAPAGTDRAPAALFKAIRHTQIGAGRSTGHGRAWWWDHEFKGKA